MVVLPSQGLTPLAIGCRPFGAPEEEGWRRPSLLLLAQPRQHRVVLQRRRVAGGLPPAGDVAQQPPHDLARARLRQALREADLVRPRQRPDLLDDVVAQLLLQLLRRLDTA